MNKLIERRATPRGAQKDIIVLYHFDCADGFGAAWAAFRHFGKKAQYIGVKHQVPMPANLTDKEIYMLDFTYPKELTEELMRTNKRVTAVDHHISVKDVTLSTYQPSYALENSGAVLAWHYFHPDEPVPTLLKYVEDQDLHRFALPDTQSISDWLDQYDFDFKVWNGCARTLEKPTSFRRAVRQGTIVRQYREKLVQRIVTKVSYPVIFEGHRCLVVNSELFHSDIANELVSRHPPIGIVWRQHRQGVYVSLRSDGTVDVSALAARYHGGGHRAAAGFLVASTADLPFKRV